MAVAIAWLPGPAGTRRRVAKLSVEEPDAAEPARPDLWGARVSNDPGLPDPGAATGTINRETSALHRMGTLAVHWGWLDTVPGFPDRLRENPPRQGFFEHPEYLAVRAHLPVPWQDILDLAYYSGWRKQEILGLSWDEIDEAGGVIRLSPARSKTLVGRILPISQPIAEALARRRARRDPDSPLVFHRDGITVRRWRTAWRTACQAAGVPTRFLHDCRRTAARNLIRANVPERVAMLLTGHKSRAIFDRYNIIHEQELLEAGDQLVAYLAQHAQATPRGGRPYPAGTAVPRTAPPASCDAPPRSKGARSPGTGSLLRAAGAGHRPSGRRRSRPDHRYEPARDRGTRGDGAGRRGQPRARAQGLDNQLLQRPPPPGRSDADMQRCERLGGLLGFYESGRPINRTLRPGGGLGPSRRSHRQPNGPLRGRPRLGGLLNNYARAA